MSSRHFNDNDTVSKSKGVADKKPIVVLCVTASNKSM